MRCVSMQPAPERWTVASLAPGAVANQVLLDRVVNVVFLTLVTALQPVLMAGERTLIVLCAAVDMHLPSHVAPHKIELNVLAAAVTATILDALMIQAVSSCMPKHQSRSATVAEVLQANLSPVCCKWTASMPHLMVV